MSTDPILKNFLREQRLARGWPQEELARRTGLSRAGISAIEVERVVPSATAALLLAAAFDCRVEDLFRLPEVGNSAPRWAWPPTGDPCRFWRAEVDGRVWMYPAEVNGLGIAPPDGVARDGAIQASSDRDPAQTLVLACCDPAAGLLVHELARTSGIRLLVVPRSSGAALSLLQQGLVHFAGVHLSRADGAGNAAIVKEQLDSGYRLLHIARWQAGLALAPQRRIRSPRSAVQSRLRWVGREVGSGARQCLDELLGKKTAFRRIAHDHRGVAEAIRCGWAEAGVSLRLTSEEAGLDFFGLREEAYDLCFHARLEGDPRFAALLQVVRSSSYRGMLGDLPGYNSSATGTIQDVED